MKSAEPTLGWLLREYRLAAGLTQEELAERAQLSPRSVGALERGAQTSPYPSTLRRLADGLELSPRERAALLAAGRSPTGSGDEPDPEITTEVGGSSVPGPIPLHGGSVIQRPGIGVWRRPWRSRGLIASAAVVLLAGSVILALSLRTHENAHRALALNGSIVAGWGASSFDPRVLRRPEGIAADPRGDVYVVDARSDCIFRFSASGRPLQSWGEKGTGPGQLETPSAIAVDGQGAVYVADTGNNRIQVFNAAGRLLAVWGAQRSSALRLDRPDGIAVDAQGFVYVSDSGHNRIQMMSTQGAVAGDYRTDIGGLFPSTEPGPLAIDASERAYLVGDSGVGVGDLAGHTSWAGLWRPAGDVSHVQVPVSVAVDSHQQIYVADGWSQQVLKFSQTGRLLMRIGGRGAGPGRFVGIGSVVVGPQGDVYVTDVASGRVERFSRAGKFVSQWGPTTSPSISDPEAVAVGADGTVYVADANAGRIAVLSSTGRLLALWGSEGSGRGELKAPLGLAIDRRGHVFVADSGNNRIQEFSASGAVLAVRGGSLPPGSPPRTPGYLYQPAGVATDSGRVFVADTFNGRVQVFDSRGRTVGLWAHLGPLAALQTTLPSAVAAGPHHRIYVGDPWLGRISVLLPDGRLLRYWTVSHGKSRGFGLAVDRVGRVYVANPATGHIEVFASDGSRLGEVSDGASRPMTFTQPIAVAVDASGSVYVAEPGRHTVAKLAPPSHA
jgi:DNA-binding beta-propeller fold protein YncE/DNA-binding XRE family transcriptional regulator